VKQASVDKEGGQESPKLAPHEIVEAEDEVLFGKLRVLLPSPKAYHYACEYKERVDSQVIVGSSCPEVYLTLLLVQRSQKADKGNGQDPRPEPLSG
jgi:hypothetical protein